MSTLVPLATPDEMVMFYDENVVADLVSDDGDQETSLATNATLLKMLSAAEGRVESACTVAGIYTPDNLALLTGSSLSLLQEIVCAIAMANLLRRRPGKYSEIAESVKEYEEYLDRLRKGERIFGGATEVREAGVVNVDGPTIATYEKLNLIPDRTQHFYPNRSSRLPIGRG